MTSVPDNWDLNFRVVWHLLLFTMFVGGHRNLEASRHGLEFVCSSHITVLQARSHWVNIEEGIFSVLNVCSWFPVQRLMTLISNCWQI